MKYHSGMVSVIVRFHNFQRLSELSNALFSLACQNHEPLEIIIALQRFSRSDQKTVTQLAKDILELHPHAEYCILNYKDKEPADARSILANMGLRAASGQYVTFLDHDDVLYPDAYTVLTETNKKEKTAISFASVMGKIVEVEGNVLLTRQKLQLFGQATSLVELWKQNHCPIHSFILNRLYLRDEDLLFDEQLIRHEDYDFLLKITSRYASDFALKSRMIGEYTIKTDGSNSILDSTFRQDKLGIWEEAEQAISKKRNSYIVDEKIRSKICNGNTSPGDPISSFLRPSS